MSALSDALSGKDFTKGLGIVGHDASAVASGANRMAQGLTGNLKTGAPGVLNPLEDAKSGAFTRGMEVLGINPPGHGGSSGPAAAPTDYWTQSIGGPNSTYSVMNGIDSNKLMQYFQQTQPGFNANDPKQVATALSTAMQQGWIQPSFLAGQQSGNDPLTQQAMFQGTIKPFLNQLSQGENTALKDTEGIQNQIQSKYGASESPDVKALLGNLNASVDQQGSQDMAFAQQSALTGPGITDILDALRAQYINQLNTLTTGTGTTAPAKLPAPSTLTAVNNALAG